MKAAALLLCASLTACGGHAQVSAYATATTACVAAEAAVVAREFESEEHQLDVLNTVHEACSVILASIRRFIDGGDQ